PTAEARLAVTQSPRSTDVQPALPRSKIELMSAPADVVRSPMAGFVEKLSTAKLIDAGVVIAVLNRKLPNAQLRAYDRGLREQLALATERLNAARAAGKNDAAAKAQADIDALKGS